MKASSASPQVSLWACVFFGELQHIQYDIIQAVHMSIKFRLPGAKFTATRHAVDETCNDSEVRTRSLEVQTFIGLGL